jgi:hypothetical protein
MQIAAAQYLSQIHTVNSTTKVRGLPSNKAHCTSCKPCCTECQWLYVAARCTRTGMLWLEVSCPQHGICIYRVAMVTEVVRYALQHLIQCPAAPFQLLFAMHPAAHQRSLPTAHSQLHVTIDPLLTIAVCLILPWLGWCATLTQAKLCQLNGYRVDAARVVSAGTCSCHRQGQQALVLVIDKVNSLLVTSPKQVQVSLAAADVHPCSFVRCALCEVYDATCSCAGQLQCLQMVCLFCGTLLQALGYPTQAAASDTTSSLRTLLHCCWETALQADCYWFLAVVDLATSIALTNMRCCLSAHQVWLLSWLQLGYW